MLQLTSEEVESLRSQCATSERAEGNFLMASGAEFGVEMPRIEPGESKNEDAGYFC
jgi:hypothetical protein